MSSGHTFNMLAVAKVSIPEPPSLPALSLPADLNKAVDNFKKRQRSVNRTVSRPRPQRRFDITTQLQTHIAARRAKNQSKKKRIDANGYIVMAASPVPDVQ